MGFDWFFRCLPKFIFRDDDSAEKSENICSTVWFNHALVMARRASKDNFSFGQIQSWMENIDLHSKTKEYSQQKRQVLTRFSNQVNINSDINKNTFKIS